MSVSAMGLLARAGRHPQVRILAMREPRRLAVGGLIGRLREGGVGLALILGVRAMHGSFALAGATTAAYLLGAALTRPLHGRWVDRRGVAGALLLTSTLNASGLVACAAAVWLRLPAALMPVLAGVSGLTLPALSAALRALWPRVISGPPDHAYAFDTLLYEVSLVAAPALVGTLGVLVSAPAALLAVAGAGMAGTLIVISAPAARARAATAPGCEQRPLRGAVLWLIAVSLGVGMAEGSLTVIAPGFASSHHAPGASGLILSALSMGSLVGALGYSALVTRSRWPRRLVASAAALTLSLTALALGGVTLAAFVGLAVLVGCTLSPTLTTGFIAIADTSPPGSLAEAFTWASFCATAGAAAGQAMGGAVISSVGIGPALWEPALAAALACLIAAAGLRRGALRAAG